MIARWWSVALVALFAGCGGGGGGGGSSAGAPSNASTPAQQSAGGMWFALSGPAPATTTLMVAETGELRVLMTPTGTNGPGFGQGTVTVTGNRVEGTFKSRVLGSAGLASTDLDCTVSGTVSTRAAMQLTSTCVDSAGTSTTASLSFMYDARYEADSSLAAIAGNYTLSLNSATNTLNINGDGTLFGMYQNGPRCTLNGTVSIINGDFALYRFEVLFSNCTFLASRYEGKTMTGFAHRNPPGQKAGAFLLLMTAVIDGQLEFASVMYEPV